VYMFNVIMSRSMQVKVLMFFSSYKYHWLRHHLTKALDKIIATNEYTISEMCSKCFLFHAPLILHS